MISSAIRPEKLLQIDLFNYRRFFASVSAHLRMVSDKPDNRMTNSKMAVNIGVPVSSLSIYQLFS